MIIQVISRGHEGREAELMLVCQAIPCIMYVFTKHSMESLGSFLLHTLLFTAFHFYSSPKNEEFVL
jgi:hypothetical protein